MACTCPYQRARCRKKSARGKAGRSAVSASGVCGEEQMASLTVPELRAMAKARCVLAFCNMNTLPAGRRQCYIMSVALCAIHVHAIHF